MNNNANIRKQNATSMENRNNIEPPSPMHAESPPSANLYKKMFQVIMNTTIAASNSLLEPCETLRHNMAERPRAYYAKVSLEEGYHRLLQ